MSRDPVVVVPGDLDVEDRVAGPVTFRMAAWLAAAVGGVAVVATSRGAPALVALGLLLVVVGLCGACWQPGGRPVGAWIVPLIAYRKRRAARPATTAREEPVAPAPTADEVPVPSRDGNGARTQRAAVAVVVVAATVVAVVAVARATSRTSPTPAAPAPAPVVVSPEPAGPPVVVLVPVDPFTPWEVTDDGLSGLDLGCGC